jgi:hypothetical protein
MIRIVATPEMPTMMPTVIRGLSSFEPSLVVA